MDELIPLRWPEEWTDAARLELLKGTPINCLVGEQPPPFPLSELKFLRPETDLAAENIIVREGVWPGIKGAKEADTADAGPTGGPWVDSNDWMIRLEQATNPGKTIWLDFSPPDDKEVVSPDRFLVPVVEAGAYGSRWILTLNKSFREGLVAGSDAAVGAWRGIGAALELFRERPEWRDWETVASLAVISDFEGENEFLSREFLNLAARRGLAYELVLKSGALQASLEQKKAVLYLDTAPPEGKLLERLMDFVRGGGLLVVPAGLSLAAPATTERGHDIHPLGKGRIAVPQEEWYDPFVLAEDIHLLISHREDPVRIWNGSSVNNHYVARQDGSKALVHLIRLGSSMGTSPPLTIGLAKEYRSARVRTLDSETAVTPIKRRLGIEIPIPDFSTYAAVELES